MRSHNTVINRNKYLQSVLWIRIYHYLYGSFHQQAKKSKTCNSIIFLLLFYFLSLKTDVPSKRNKQQTLQKNLIRIRSQWYGTVPIRYVTDPPQSLQGTGYTVIHLQGTVYRYFISFSCNEYHPPFWSEGEGKMIEKFPRCFSRTFKFQQILFSTRRKHRQVTEKLYIPVQIKIVSIQIE